jgi:hypothetical protein
MLFRIANMQRMSLDECVQQYPFLLFEAKYVLSNEDFVAFTADRSGSPTGIFVGVGYPLKDADKIYYSKVNSSQFKKAREAFYDLPLEIKDTFIHFYEDLADKAYTRERLISDLKILSKKMPKIFSSKEIKRDDAYKIVTTDFKVGDNYWERFFGAKPEEGSVAEFKVGDSYITFPENARESNIEQMKKVVEDVYKTFKKNGLGPIMTGPIRFVKLTGKTIGSYDIANKNININYNAKSDKQTLKTLFHEYGHKWWYEFIPSEVDKIKEQFYALRKSGNKFDSSSEQDAKNDLAKQVVKLLKVGDEFIYKGRKARFKGSYIIRDIDGIELKLSRPDSKDIAVGGSAYVFIKPDWEVKGKKKVNDIFKKGIELATPNQDDWFPTQYSTTAAEEWYSELFSYYMMGELKGAPKEFIKKTLK